jgi:hypothetical protein
MKIKAWRTGFTHAVLLPDPILFYHFQLFVFCNWLIALHYSYAFSIFPILI